MWAQLSSFHHVFACTHRGKLQGSSCLGNRRTKVFWRDWDHLQHLTCVNNSSEKFLLFLPFSSDLNWHLFPGKTDFNSSVPFVQEGSGWSSQDIQRSKSVARYQMPEHKTRGCPSSEAHCFFRNVSAGLFPFLGREKLICWGWMITPQPQWGSRKFLLCPAFHIQPGLCSAAWGHSVWQISALVQSPAAPQGCFYRAWRVSFMPSYTLTNSNSSSWLN